MYIVKLLSGSVIKTGSFLAVDENYIKYFATEYFQMANKNVFLEFEKNGNEKFAVIINQEVTGNWAGYTFRNIQFISSCKEFCKNYKSLKTQEMKNRYEGLGAHERLVELIKSNQALLNVKNLEIEIQVIQEQRIVITNKLEKLLQNNI
jgi:hypothetical protein